MARVQLKVFAHANAALSDVFWALVAGDSVAHTLTSSGCVDLQEHPSPTVTLAGAKLLLSSPSALLREGDVVHVYLAAICKPMDLAQPPAAAAAGAASTVPTRKPDARFLAHSAFSKAVSGGGLKRQREGDALTATVAAVPSAAAAPTTLPSSSSSPAAPSAAGAGGAPSAPHFAAAEERKRKKTRRGSRGGKRHKKRPIASEQHAAAAAPAGDSAAAAVPPPGAEALAAPSSEAEAFFSMMGAGKPPQGPYTVLFGAAGKSAAAPQPHPLPCAPAAVRADPAPRPRLPRMALGGVLDTIFNS